MAKLANKDTEKKNCNQNNQSQLVITHNNGKIKWLTGYARCL